LVRSEIAKKLQEKHPNLNISQISAIIDILLSAITDNLANSKSIEIRTWGRFSVKTIKAKLNARNPRTNEVIYVPEKKKISFKMSTFLKKKMNKNL
tara:strand:+ start:218 stop:505 length:288 start_codon:yes stop_codon:yes gene_type:complete